MKYKIVEQECDQCGKHFKIRYWGNGSYTYETETCECESEFHPVDDMSMSEWLKTIR